MATPTSSNTQGKDSDSPEILSLRDRLGLNPTSKTATPSQAESQSSSESKSESASTSKNDADSKINVESASRTNVDSASRTDVDSAIKTNFDSTNSTYRYIPTQKLIQDLDKINILLKTANADRLPDKGERLKRNKKVLEDEIAQRALMRNMSSTKNPNSLASTNPQPNTMHHFKPNQTHFQQQVVPKNYSHLMMPRSNPQAYHPNQNPQAYHPNQNPQAYHPNQNRVPISQIYHANKPFPPPTHYPSHLPPHVWQQLYAANPQMQTLYGGRMTQARKEEVKSVTTDAVEKMHASLQTCPAETDEVGDPLHLRVALLPHQRQALAWMLWRENQHPPGGILADDMGLGKTLTILSLILKRKQTAVGNDKEDLDADNEDAKKKNLIPSRASLIICPASIIQQWGKEIENRIKSGTVRYLLYHGTNRERNMKKLANYDIVITSFESIRGEAGESAKSKPSDSSILSILWESVVLDEGHNIKNAKSKTALAVCKLRAKIRWVATGTPVHNDLLDMYSLLRFLRFTPFDELQVWKKWVDNKSESGQERLQTIIRGLMLRRTKDQTNANGSKLVPLPTKEHHLYKVTLSPDEQRIYDKVFEISKLTLTKYLKQQQQKKEDKENEVVSDEHKNQTTVPPVLRAADFLVLLLRLRQCCCHLSLIKKKADKDTSEVEDVGDDLVAQLANLNINENAPQNETKPEIEGVAVKTIIDAIPEDTPHFKIITPSAKIGALLAKLENIHTKEAVGIKSIVVSQWTGVLNIVAHHLELKGLKYHAITGEVAAKTRTIAIDDFNNNIDGPPIMLLSLRAGGVGLNLIGGSHVFLFDIHWNPQLENQACDRVYRVGQKRNVHIHKFLCENTVEEKIAQLQKKKLNLASNVLSGTKVQANRLTLDDLKVLFGVNASK